MGYLWFTIAAYLSGSVLYSYLLPKIFLRKDICSISDDGNPGAFNVFKYAGTVMGIISLICDLAKGFYPVYKASQVLEVSDYRFIFVFIAPVIGHAHSLFLKGRGGKGIAVSFGVLLGLLPNYRPVFLLAFLYLFFSIVVVIKPNYFRSIITYVLFLCLSIVLLPIRSVKIGCVIIACIIIKKHQDQYKGEHMTISSLRNMK